MRRTLALALLVAGCGRAVPDAAPSGGAAMERAARDRGLVTADAKATATGVFRSGTDTVCMVTDGGDFRLGASVDYGEGQRCVVRAKARGGATLSIDAGGGCRLEARVDADRLAFPAVVPSACDAFCTGRASLSALEGARLSDSASEASRVRGADGRLLCGS